MDFINAKITANIGTPSIIPAIPNSPPNNVMAKMTQKLESPVELPKIFGPMILPSTCCNKNTNTRKYSACTGSINNINIKEGTAPRNGPKNGTILVTPTITLIKTLNGVPIMLVHTKHKIPIMIESNIFPTKNPPKVLLEKRTLLTKRLAASNGINAYVIFLNCAAKSSLLANTYMEIMKPIMKFQDSFKKEYTPVDTITIILFNCGRTLALIISSNSVEYLEIISLAKFSISGLSSSNLDIQ